MNKLLIYFSAVLLILLVCIKRFYRIFSWFLRIFLIFLSIFIIVWMMVGRSLFLWPTSFANAAGKRRCVAPKLYVMDSNNKEAHKFVILLQGKCAPLPKARETSRKKWANRMKQIADSGFRVFLIEHRWGLFQDNLNQRITDLDDTYHYLANNYPDNMIVVVGGSFGVTVAFKWAAQKCRERMAMSHLIGVVGLSPTLSFSNAMSRVLLPYFLIPDAMPNRQMMKNTDNVVFGDDEEDNDPYDKEEYLIFPMNMIAGRIPMMLVYCSDDPSADYQIWERWYEQHTHHKYIGNVPPIQMIRLRNTRKYRGLQSHTESPLTDKNEWIPRVSQMFDSREYYLDHFQKKLSVAF